MNESVSSGGFRPVRGEEGTLAEQVARQITDLIASKDLKVGSRLPTQDELTVRLGVSRTAVREAIQLLTAWGVLGVRQGVGTFVTNVGENALHVPFMLSALRSGKAVHDLHQVREAIEPPIAAIAVENATPHHIEALQKALSQMDKALEIGDPVDFIDADLEFHSTLARATGNDLFLVVIYPVIGLLREARYLTQHTPGAMERGQRYHRQILEDIKKRDPEKARETMRQHLDQVWHDLEPHLGTGLEIGRKALSADSGPVPETAISTPGG